MTSTGGVLLHIFYCFTAVLVTCASGVCGEAFQRSSAFVQAPSGVSHLGAVRIDRDILLSGLARTRTYSRLAGINSPHHNSEMETLDNHHTVVTGVRASLHSDPDHGSLNKLFTNTEPEFSPVEKLEAERDSLYYEFVGYSIWLEVEQYENDLYRAISIAAEDLGLFPIPEPHVTAIYGMTHLAEEEIKDKFASLRQEIESWPSLRVKGLITDTEQAGVSGGLMDMAWSELTLATSPKHECLLDHIYDVFFDGTPGLLPKRNAWIPHLSLSYDNPENSQVDINHLLRVLQRVPSLLATKQRRVTGLTLWNTSGKMEKWKCLERISFQAEIGDAANVTT
eukprot:scaffold36512_cov59-Attheya_sp.AAC.5